jgi:hypothetical protein
MNATTTATTAPRASDAELKGLRKLASAANALLHARSRVARWTSRRDRMPGSEIAMPRVMGLRVAIGRAPRQQRPALPQSLSGLDQDGAR